MNLNPSATPSARRSRTPWVVLGIMLAGLVPAALEHLSSRAAATARGAAVAALPGQPPAAPDPALRPPPARWRIAHPAELQDVWLPLSYIVISHRDATPVHGFVFEDPGASAWRASHAFKASRTRGQALALARSLADELGRHPKSFERLAREHSDDPLSRPFGGRLGNVPAAELAPVHLDAVGPLRAGQVSQLVETGVGFQLFKLEAPPPAVTVSGQRVAIPYIGTIGFEHAAAGTLPTREQALAVASAVAEEVRAGRGDLIATARSRARLNELLTGDTGAWSMRDASPYIRGAELELDVLSRLEPGTVSLPIDSAYGFQLLQRTDAGRTQPYAYQGVVLRFDPALPEGAAYSRADVLGLARTAIAEVGRNPQRFAELQAQHCCAQTVQFHAGLRQFDLAALLSKTAIGSVAPVPLEGFGYVAVIKRMPYTPEPARVVSNFELPKPDAPDLVLLIEHGDGQTLARATRALTKSTRERLPLSSDQNAAIGALFERLADQLAASKPGPERMAMVTQALDRTRQLLGPALHGQYIAHMNEWTTQYLLHGE